MSGPRSWAARPKRTLSRSRRRAMPDRASGYVRKLWALRSPLDLDGESPVSRLAYWIEQSGRDPWTYDDLQRLIGELLDTGRDPPPPLEHWAREVAAGRRNRPNRSGPKSDSRRDLIIRVLVEMMSGEEAFDGQFGFRKMTQKQAFKLIADALHKSPEAIAGARRRGLKM